LHAEFNANRVMKDMVAGLNRISLMMWQAGTVGTDVFARTTWFPEAPMSTAVRPSGAGEAAERAHTSLPRALPAAWFARIVIMAVTTDATRQIDRCIEGRHRSCVGFRRSIRTSS
jgi:hypothetical protein